MPHRRVLLLLLTAQLVVAVAHADSDLTQKLRPAIKEVFAATAALKSGEELLATGSRAVGPAFVRCLDYGADRKGRVLLNEAFGDFPPDGADAVVGLRSLSKIIASVTFAALTDRGLVKLEDTVSSSLGYDCGSASTATMGELLAMASPALDHRVNAVRIRQLAKRSDVEIDFVGFPPLCDEEDDLKRPEDCIAKFFCPLMRGEFEAMQRAEVFAGESPETLEVLRRDESRRRRYWFEAFPDRTCERGMGGMSIEECETLRKQGVCASHARSMFTYCAYACPPYRGKVCDRDHALCAASKCENATMRKECPETCPDKPDWEEAPDPLASTPRPRAFEWYYDMVNNVVARKLRAGIVYDNYGYTLVDAVVTAKTGKGLMEWSRELVLGPLQMDGALECTLGVCGEEEGKGVCRAGESPEGRCFAPPATIPDTLYGSTRWPRNSQRAPYSSSWIGNAYWGSARDLASLFGMLVLNGTSPATGERVLSPEAVERVFDTRYNRPQRPFGSCLGVQEYGLGVGYCRWAERAEFDMGSPFADRPTSRGFKARRQKKSPFFSPDVGGSSMCIAPNWYGWASSHGSRVVALRDRQVVCAVVLNTPSGRTPEGEVFNARSHYVGHNVSAVLREVFD